MPSENIQWFPGHMAKTRRLIKENLSSVDVIIEVLDARIPYSSRNPEITSLIGDKPIVSVLNKSSLADPDVTSRWKTYFEEQSTGCLFIDSITGDGIKELPNALFEILEEKISSFRSRGMVGRTVKAMVVGIPNVGKSTLINRLAGAKKAKAEDHPGVTLTKQWVRVRDGLDLMDMPGVLWPKFDNRTVGENLAVTGAIRDAVLDIESLAVILCGRLRKSYPRLLADRYKLDMEDDFGGIKNYELFELIGRKRGFLISGGEISYERTAVMLLDEFRSAKIGRISLETPLPGE